MKLKLLLLVLAFAKCPGPVKAADLFDDQPKILVNDGNLVFESADSRDVSVRLKGKSQFLINGVDVLGSLNTSNGSSGDASGDNSSKIKSLQTQVARLKSVINGQQGILNRIDRLELGIPANATIPSGTLDRTRVNALNRRIAALEQRVANLTERLMRDHCKSYPCQNGGTCFNMFETFRCECTDAWQGPTCSLDVNECAQFAGTDLGCQNSATCINTPGSYDCQCTDQWKGQHCNRQKMDCMNVPRNEICGHGTCVQAGNKFGYTCICEQGWRQSNETQSCTVDIDECTEMRPHCSTNPKVMCVNTPGSFVCGACPPGYVGNGFTCEDINECEINNGGCSVSPFVECVNKRGSSRCGNCPLGYIGDGRTCSVSEIRPNSQCTDSSICNENAQCFQYPNSPPKCTCHPGYSGNGFGAAGCTFVGMDACVAMRCQNGGTCVKNGTSAYCLCPLGTSRPLCDRTSDACASGPCLNGGTCTNGRFGRRYRCACIRGFTGVNCNNQVRRCGGVRNEESGTIRYPENPLEPYTHNARCAWLIKTNHTKVLNVTFSKFDLEPSRDCKFDWLQIHDGRSSSSYMIGRFCGNTMPKNTGNIISTHNMLYLWFRSDNSTAHDGFELTWESIDPVCGGELNVTTHGTISSPGSPGQYPMNRDCEWFITAPPSKRIQFLFYTLMIESHETCAFDFVEIHSGLGSETPSLGKFCNTTSPPPLLTPSHTATIHFHSDGDSSDAGFQIAFSVVEGVPGCGGIYTNAKGDIMSPLNIIDGKYKHNVMCDYVIQMPKDSRVRIEFKKFALESSSACKFDKVEIFEGSVYDEEKLIGRYCGTNMPPIITSQTNIITVKFTSDWSSNDEGFQFQYVLMCGGVFAEDNGIISSPNYPSPYAGERNCEYDIAAPLGKTVILNVMDLDIEMHSQCEFDNLEIFDGVSDDNATSFGRFCGETKPPSPFVSSFNHLRIHFTSDASVNGRGFTANYTFVDVECGGIIRNASELIRSPMDTDGNGVYKSNSYCKWLVFAPVGYVIQMNFLNFELEKDSQCKYDFVKIFNNGSGKGEAMGPFCGTNAPKVITTLDHIATILFKTDSSNSKEGFTISLAFIDSNKLCGANYFSSQGMIKSPGEPEYLPNKDCEWVITAPQNKQIEINFIYFDIESHAECRFDKLEIRNGGNNFAPLIGRFCGEIIPPPFKSFSNQLYFKFISDSSRGGKGFAIEWDATSTGCGGRITTTKGSISSPNYPESYTHNAQCEWQVSVNEGSIIGFIFTDLDMESQNECKYDYLEIFDGSDSSSKSFGKYCSADNHPMHLETVGNHAVIRMSTDDSQAGRGFFMKYSIICNRTIHADSGVIESPNFPSDYPPNTDCAWTIVVSKGNRISYQFSHFHLENDNQFHNETNDHICKYDWMEISDMDFEAKTERNQKSKFCNNAPDPKISLGDSIVIVFHTDASASGSGFRMEWYVEGCGGKLNHPEGTITSPDYPKKYNHQLTCIWEITVEYGYKIEVTINDLEMETSATCEYDSLTMANDQSFNDTVVKICNTQTMNHVFTTKSHQLFVKFNADDSNNGRGFNLTYKSVFSDCGGKFVGSNGLISTPSFPTHNYENNKICEWNIMTDKSHTLVLQLSDFDLETSDNCTKDFVEILDPVYNKTLWKGCGNQLPNVTTFKSEQNELTVRLVTDNEITAKGFKANYTNSCGGRIVTNETGDFEFRYTRDSTDCQWIIISEDPAKKIVLTFTYVNIFLETIDGCLSKVEVFEGDSDKGVLKKTFCGTKTPPAIYSNGRALTVKLNTTSLSFVSEFDIHYSVVDNACGGDYSMSTNGEFASPNFPLAAPLNAYCIWKISASEGHKMSLTFNQLSVASSPNCNDNYVEIRKKDQNGALVGVFCGNELPPNIVASQAYWIKFQTDGISTSGGFVAEYKYTLESELEGSSGKIESPNYPKFFVTAAHQFYRITVKQGSVIRIEFPHFYFDEEDEDECFAYLKVYNGFDSSAPNIRDEICSDSPEPIISDGNIVYIEFMNNHMSKTKFQLTWKEVDKVQNLTNLVDSECGDKIILLKNETEVVNITSPGYPTGYGTGLNCTWTIMSGISYLHPVIVLRDVDLEDLTDCVGDYLKISTDREDGSWKEVGKLCTFDLRERKTYDGTPNIMLQFKTDYGINRTGFHAHTYLECGGKLTESEGIIEYTTPSIFRGARIMNDCKWNITVRRGKTIQFEFLEMNIYNGSGSCNSFVTIRNGIDDSSPYLGNGQYCGKEAPILPKTTSNRAFVKYKANLPLLHFFKLRYYEVQHECGGQIRLSRLNSSRIVSSPNYPSIPDPHIECLWTVLAPVGERIRVDFVERFDLTPAKDCVKEYVELRDGSTGASPMIGTYCTEKPTTKRSKSNVLMMKFFTNTGDPKNGFKANISIDVCGGTIRSNTGYLTSPNYPGVGAYPSKAQCEYRITGAPTQIFNITVIDIDLPSSDETVCNLERDHIVMYSVIPDFNAAGMDNLMEIATLCGNKPSNFSYLSDTNEVLVKFNTFGKSKDLFKGFKILYNASRMACGGSIEGENGIITSPGYPAKTLNKLLCEWKITVPKGRRVKIELLDIDLLASNNQFLQRIGVYNDFRYSNRIVFISSNSSAATTIYSSDNRMMITMWIRMASTNRGFKLRFSSDTPTLCEGGLNDVDGAIFPPIALNLKSYSCDYIRDLKPIYGGTLHQGTIAYYFKDISIGKKISNCRYASTVVNVKRRSGLADEESFLARICGNSTTTATVASPFPDINVEVRQNPFFGPINFTMHYKTHKCGGMMFKAGNTSLVNPPASTSNEAVLDCAWFLQYEEGFSVSISITDLKLKLTCDEEYINIYNGPTALSPLIGKFCGNSDVSKENMVSQRNTVFVEYHTDNFIGSSKDSKFRINFDSASYGCGGILNRNNFNFKTPLFAKSYPPNTECIWEIRADPGYHIGLAFVDRFFIEDTVNCTKDYVEVFDFINDDWKSLGKRCGREIPNPFNSTSEKMRVIFRSDSTSAGDGFSAVWSQNCGGVFEVDSTQRILSSPGFPKSYGPQLLCNYTFVAPLKSYIKLNFLEFAVETTGNKCMYDNVTIFKVPDYAQYPYQSPMDKVGVFCGLLGPGSLRHRDIITVIFQTDKWVERKGFSLEYQLENCGGTITTSTMIQSPNIIPTTSYHGSMECKWNITAPVGKKIVIKFENFTMELSNYCSFDFVEIYNGTNVNETLRLAKICGNLTNTLKPIVIENNEAVLLMKTDQTNVNIGFSAAIYFRPKCDQVIQVAPNKPFVLDMSRKIYTESMECVFKVVGEPIGSIKMSFNSIHLARRDDNRQNGTCDYNYVEIHDGNGPFSLPIGTYCGYDLPRDIVSSGSAMYIRFVTDSINNSTGFKSTFSFMESPCGSNPYRTFTGNETVPEFIESAVVKGTNKYQPNLRCTWVAEAPYGKIFDIQFLYFELEDSEFCASDSLTIEDDNIKEYVTEGLGQEVIFRGKSSTTYTPSFYSGMSGPTAPHVYCGNNVPHDYISESNKIRISFSTNSENEFSGFNFTLKTMSSCARNFTALTGRMVSSDDMPNCKTTIKVPENYTISLFFHRFFFYEQDCTKSFLKVYDGTFENGVLLKTMCGYAMPDPIFSNKSQLSLLFHYDENTQYYSKGNYDIMYVATDKGRGCGGSIYNYGGLFTSPLYPSNNRSIYDCTWTITVPQNLRVAVRFSVFDMGSKLLCNNDFVEFLEANERGEISSVKKFCGEDDPAVFVSSKSTLQVHHAQTVNFAATGWTLNFIAVVEGSKPQNW